MPRSLNLNEALIQEAMAIDHHANLETIIETALREYIQRHQRLKFWVCLGRSTMTTPTTTKINVKLCATAHR